MKAVGAGQRLVGEEETLLGLMEARERAAAAAAEGAAKAKEEPSEARPVRQPLSVGLGQSWEEGLGEETSPSLSSSSATSASIPLQLRPASVPTTSSSPKEDLSSLSSVPSSQQHLESLASAAGLEEAAEAPGSPSECCRSSVADCEASSATVTDDGANGHQGPASTRSDDGGTLPDPHHPPPSATFHFHSSEDEDGQFPFEDPVVPPTDAVAVRTDDPDRDVWERRERKAFEAKLSPIPSLGSGTRLEGAGESGTSLVGTSVGSWDPGARKASTVRWDAITMAADADAAAFHRVDSSQLMEQLAVQSSKPKFKVVGDFLLGATLGEGTFGKVKECVRRDPRPEEEEQNRRWAAKIMKVAIGGGCRRKATEMWERMEREVRLVHGLHHQNIIRLEEVIRRPEKPLKVYLIMEFCPGSLASMLEENEARHFPEWQAQTFFRQLLEGLSYLHGTARVVHRDIKPSNLLVSENEVLKISDFGEACELEDNGSDICKAGEGTPQFVAPEVASGYTEVRGFPLDVWASGVTLFNLLVGDYPFSGETLLLLYENISLAPLSFPAELQLSPLATDLLKGILQKEPDQRFSLADIAVHPWLGLSLPTYSSARLLDEEAPRPQPKVPVIVRKLTKSYQTFRESLDEDPMEAGPVAGPAPTSVEAKTAAAAAASLAQSDESDEEGGFSFSVGRKASWSQSHQSAPALPLPDPRPDPIPSLKPQTPLGSPKASPVKKSSAASQPPLTAVPLRLKDAIARRLSALRPSQWMRRTQSDSAMPTQPSEPRIGPAAASQDPQTPDGADRPGPHQPSHSADSRPSQRLETRLPPTREESCTLM